MACSCNSNSGTWKVFNSKGSIVKAFGSTDRDEVKAKAYAKTVAGATARKTK